MSFKMTQVSATKALFIKLGEGGIWQAECIENGTLRFSYREVPHDICQTGNWPEVERKARGFSKDKGSATRHVNQIRQFYEADEKVLWVTFHSNRLWWCFSNPAIRPLPNGERIREVVTPWSDCDTHGERLLFGKISGKLLATRGFRGTICTISDVDYLLHKINGTNEPHVVAALTAFESLQRSLIPIIQKLHEKDLEILVDLVFRQAGWQRIGVSGGTEKDIDLDLISPVTGERIAVQVKSRASVAVWQKYRKTFADMKGFTRFYFVTHSPDDSLQMEADAADDPDFVLWGIDQLAGQAVRGGLTGWLLDKAS